jgi:hypothetical protein
VDTAIATSGLVNNLLLRLSGQLEELFISLHKIYIRSYFEILLCYLCPTPRPSPVSLLLFYIASLLKFSLYRSLFSFFEHRFLVLLFVDIFT